MGEEKEKVALPTLRVEPEIAQLVTELCFDTVEGVRVKVCQPTDVMREALIRGLKVMLEIRREKERLAKKEVKEYVKKSS